MNNIWHTPALRGVLGDWIFYPSLLTAQQIAQHVIPSKDIRESKELDDYLQRDLKPRVNKIARYIKTKDTRFFNAILLGIFDTPPSWVELDLRTVRQKLEMPQAEDPADSMGLLRFTGREKIFAIDGQHRAEAIRKGSSDFPDRIASDQYPVIFLAHLDNKEGKIRTRRLFCDINKNAVPVSKGDKVIIDEDEPSAIVTRRIYAEYPHFKNGEEIAVTEKIELVAKDGKEYFCSLLGIYNVCKKLDKLFSKESGTQPNDKENIINFQKVVTAFFDLIIEHEPSLRRYFIDHKTTPEQERAENRNLVFRPIGLELLARLYVHFITLDLLPAFKWALKHVPWENPNGVWDGTVWSRGRIYTKAKAIAFNYVLYLLHQLPLSKKPKLIADLRDWRKDQNYKIPKQLPVPVSVLPKESRASD